MIKHCRCKSCGAKVPVEISRFCLRQAATKIERVTAAVKCALEDAYNNGHDPVPEHIALAALKALGRSEDTKRLRFLADCAVEQGNSIYRDQFSAHQEGMGKLRSLRRAIDKARKAEGKR